MERAAVRDMIGCCGLAPGVKRAAHQRATERTVRQQPAVIPRERHTLRHALVNNIITYLGQPVHVRLPGAVIATLDRLVKQPEHRVIIIRVILRRVNTPLRRDRMRPPGRILIAERRHVIPQLRQARRGRTARETRAHDDNIQFLLVGGTHHPDMSFMVGPFLGQRSCRYFSV